MPSLQKLIEDSKKEHPVIKDNCPFCGTFDELMMFNPYSDRYWMCKKCRKKVRKGKNNA